MKYKIISDRKNQDVKLIDAMDKAKEQVQPMLLEAFAAIIEKDEGVKMSVEEAHARYEALANGFPRPKKTMAKARAIEKEKEKEDVEVVEAELDDELLFFPE